MRGVVRLIVGLFVLLVLLLVAGFPVRAYVDQQRSLTSTSERLAVLEKTNKQLEAQSKELHSDAAVERLAREQYNLVRPGEEAYAILPGPNAAKPAAPATAAAHKVHRSFGYRLWHTITFWN